MFWQGVVLILRLRAKLALRSCARSVATLPGLAFVLLVGGPASFAAARICHARLASASPGTAPDGLSVILLAVQAVYLVALLPRLGVTLGRTLPASLLRPLPVRPMQIVVAGALGAILDTPILFALPVFVAVAAWAGHSRSSGAAVMACVVLSLLTLQTAALSQMLEQGGRWIISSRRGGLVLLLGVIGLALSFFLFPGSGMTGVPVPLRGTAPPTHFPGWAACLPGGIAATAIDSLTRGGPGFGGVALLALAALVPTTLWIAARFCAAAEAYESAALSPPSRRKTRALSPVFTNPGVSLTAAVFGLEWRCLIRDSAAYLPLRGPATLLLTVFLGWIAPNVGDDPILTLRDLVAMATLFYLVLVQLQLLCNRFGNENGTAGMLLSLPAPRRSLLVGKNLALLCLLLPLDTALAVAFSIIAHTAWSLIGMVVAETVMVVVVMTAIGNLVSVTVPFAIAKRGEEFRVEPDRSLIFVYCGVAAASGFAGWGLLQFRNATSGGVAALIAAPCLAALYVASVLLAERMLVLRERRVLASLEGEEL